MAQAKVVREPITPVSHDLDKAYELGKLSGEVRILKWGVGVARCDAGFHGSVVRGNRRRQG